MASLSRIGSLTAAAILLASAAVAQGYPDRQVTMVVPFAAGGPTDTVARLVAEKMSADLGQQIIVENVGGAGGTLGAAQVAEAEADGYTILLHHIGMATSESLYRELPYNALEAFAPVGLVTEVPMTVVARADFEPADMASFVTYVKENADTITMANAGIGAASHLCGMLLMQALEAPIVTVPYRGTGPAMTELVGGQIDIMCDQTTNTTEQIQGGTIKAYAVTTPERLDLFPDLPTAAEAGLPGIEVSVWHGIYAPAGTPQEAVDRLSTSLQTVLADPELSTRLAELGTAPSPVEDGTPEALSAKLSAEIERWRPIIEEAGVYAD
ncbi:tripartite tricarboxylate transporter substrate binding protein BugD [Rubellimicrobium rubrum]|uniref:Tripartite tricarboxylate transporter substrate binding protein BugD n=1 Tax=Rubellimicrobium rubrum TaxID=2585369 RepID=A0A5C4MS73_9RHOB|nr:tripartite tricarboxylate transporter substrate-binding protein [Rubellimicrobium rubrum]TNC46930.1 tripartite tricarboxylate transporter substrate binding protein BugD [Rubellimicrobium rubrum]